jgi:hypothetical protein
MIEDKHINELINRAKMKAKSIRKKEIKSVEDLIWFLKTWWCQYYKRPLKDALLDSYDLQELMLEFFLFTEVDETKETNKMITDNKEELASLFDDVPLGEAKESVTPEEQAFLDKEWSMTEKDFQQGGQ